MSAPVVATRQAEPGGRGWPLCAAVLFDRDGTLIFDVPYLSDPRLVHPVPGAYTALSRLRQAKLPTGVVSNQSGVARGLIGFRQLSKVNAQLNALLGPFDTWQICPHGPDEGCPCRKPAPGMITAAAAALGLLPSECVMVGDIGSDVEAAIRAGARGVLVPTRLTRAEEIEAARDRAVVVDDLAAAVDVCLRWSR